MRKHTPFFCLILFVIVFACDTHEASFEDSINPLFTLTTNVIPEEGGTISPSAGNFTEGVDIQIEASPSDGFVFDRWEGDLTGDSNPKTLTFDSDKSITAHFLVKDYKLTIDIIGEGVVKESILEESEDNGGSNSTSKKIRLEAEPDAGWFFDRWEGDLTGSNNPDTIIVDDEKFITAIFKEETLGEGFSLAVNTEGAGLVEKDPDKASYLEGEEVILRAVAETGWTFKQWKGDLSGSSNPETITVDGDKSVTAVFEQEPASEFTITTSTEGAGLVEKDPDKASYLEGEEVILRAVAETGWTFKQWKGDLSGSSNPETITVDGDKSVTAVFEQDLVIVISVEEVKLYIDEMELSGFRRTRDFKTKNFILNIPLDGSPFKITHTEIPPGLYDELELEIEKPEDKNNVGDSDFWLGNRSFSLVVRGIYRGEGFIFRSDEDFEIEVDINPPLSITEGQNSIIPLIADFESWFKDSNGDILDPNDSNNKDKINKNIEDSFSNF